MTGSEKQQIGWVPVDLGDVVIERLSRGNSTLGLIVQGYRAAVGRAAVVMAVVDASGGAVLSDLPVPGPVHSMAHGEVCQVSLSIGESSPTFLHWSLLGDRQSYHEFDPDYINDGATRVWATLGEDEFYISEWPGGRLTAAEPHMGELSHEGDGLVLGADSGNLLVGSGQGIAMVAGLLGRPGEPPRQSLWSIDGEGGQPEGWQEVHLDPRPDAVTDFDEGYNVWVAGHANCVPLVFDDIGQPVETPNIALDPEHPQVLILETGKHHSHYGAAKDPEHRPVSVELHLALQVRNRGPVLLYRRAEGWAHLALPAGRLDAALFHPLHRSRVPWVVISGRLFRPVVV